MLDGASAGPAAGTLEASVMALIQLPAQPRRDLARLGARGCFNEKSGVRGWLWLRGPGGGGLRGLPPSSCPHPLRAALPPARALPALGPHGGAWGPLKRQRFPTSRGPWVQPVMRSQGDAVGPGGWGGAQRTTVRGEGRSLAVCHRHTGTKGLSPWPRHCALAGLGLLVSNSSAPLGLPHENWLH